MRFLTYVGSMGQVEVGGRVLRRNEPAGMPDDVVSMYEGQADYEVSGVDPGTEVTTTETAAPKPARRGRR